MASNEMELGAGLEPVLTRDTGYCACVVDSCPVGVPGAPAGAAVVGTYQLVDPVTQLKSGDVQMLVAGEDATGDTVAITAGTALSCSGGTFDVAWNPGADGMLAVADSTGRVVLAQAVFAADGTATMSEVSYGVVDVGEDADDGAKPPSALAVAWDNDGVEPGQAENLAVSYSDGRMAVWSVGEAALECGQPWQAHSLEAWRVAFNPFNRTVVYSGGDDALFKAWDTRMGGYAVGATKVHGAGVTSIRPSLTSEYMLATGSYDENLRMFDTRKLKVPVSEIALGGGVWMLRWHPTNPSLMAAACMYGGFAVIHSGDEFTTLTAATLSTSPAPGDDADPLAYGIDWVGDGRLMACSFYDARAYVYDGPWASL
ncbi:WD repeat protein 85 [Thecamonas trahens ATCC 50062]|uniref:methylated diphthine methylhydrolase n=1 Tax=Thecamonas trahens ATCC 50062 TaxID=461836 RepID=A0A0L0D450_THETB|nr:WD repeat protein 85 [Thecamonas trahens ATCC 50062]KNC47132.1 WD repeat protein 85 [Thecamonas trahens ATCC 50062]|eukprot:XP_013759908.1 WD repeat protein 85 [Thecamonas trahens ATCC 50062]